MTESSPERTGVSRGPKRQRNREARWLLAPKRRRLLLDDLLDRTAPVELGALGTAVATREPDTDETDENVLQRVLVDLHHVHLPMLDAVGFIVYDSDARRVDRCLFDSIEFK